MSHSRFRRLYPARLRHALILLLAFTAACSKKDNSSISKGSTANASEHPLQKAGASDPSAESEATPTFQAEDSLQSFPSDSVPTSEEPQRVADSATAAPIHSSLLAAYRKSFALDVDALREGIVERYELEALENPKAEIAYLLSKYEAGDDSVAIDLALLLAHLGNAPEQIDQAKLILEQKAEDGDASAYSELARLALLGKTEHLDPYEAIGYLEKAVAAHDPEGTYLLGVAHRLNLIPGADLEVGMEFLADAAELGNANAAKALYANLREVAYSDERPWEQSAAVMRGFLKDYPRMEEWLLSAVEHGAPADYNLLTSYYRTMHRFELADEVTAAAAQLGSFDALVSLIETNPRRSRSDSKYRESMKELLEIHTNGSRSTAGEANYLMASLTIANGSTEENYQTAKTYLERALELKNYHAGVALLRVQQGTSLAEAMREASRESQEGAYQRYQALKRQISLSSQSFHPPYPRKLAASEYPPELDAERIKGVVVIEAIIDADGTTRNPRIVESSHPGFESYAVEAVLNSEFEPALKDGTPTPSRIQIPIHFTPTR